jgi:hypothetical protein
MLMMSNATFHLLAAGKKSRESVETLQKPVSTPGSTTILNWRNTAAGAKIAIHPGRVSLDGSDK